jgi:DNA-binding NarL/FixJ family response regulator
MMRPRILLADVHTLLMEALSKLLASDFDVVGMVADGHTLLSTAVVLKPDIVVLDVSLPVLSGLDAGRRLKKLLPKVKLVYLTMNTNPEIVAEACRVGASAYVLKNSPSAELVRAMQAGSRGCLYMTPSVAKNTMGLLGKERRQKSSTRLTLRQREVLQLLSEGRSMKEVAFVLEITPRTVAYHKYRVMQDFNLTNNAALFRFAEAQVA